jgi:hypothetical protein
MCGNGTKGLRVDCLGTQRDLQGLASGCGQDWKRQAGIRRWSLPLAPKGEEAGGASELAQGACDTARRDRDGGYLCS